MTWITPYLHTGGQNSPLAAATVDGMDETAVTISLEASVLDVVDTLARVSGWSREEMTASLVVAGIEHKGFRVVPSDDI